MAKQLHKKFPDRQVKSLLEKYISKEIKKERNNRIHRSTEIHRAREEFPGAILAGGVKEPGETKNRISDEEERYSEDQTLGRFRLDL